MLPETEKKAGIFYLQSFKVGNHPLLALDLTFVQAFLALPIPTQSLYFVFSVAPCGSVNSLLFPSYTYLYSFFPAVPTVDWGYSDFN
jgi:hypothetical protein